MTDAEFIRALGGPKAVAEFLGVKPSAVSMWTQRGIAAAYYIPLWQEATRRNMSWRPPNAEGLSVTEDGRG
jgi:DNA-binding transcriptional regulator YdaS (Cro superfamily)